MATSLWVPSIYITADIENFFCITANIEKIEAASIQG